MESYYNRVKRYLLELGYEVSIEDAVDELLVVNKQEEGVNNLLIGCSDPILIMEQHIFSSKNLGDVELRSLLVKNRDIVHGAFVMDETGENVIFRDTLQIENLDRNELEGSLNSLGLLLSEYSEEIIKMSNL
jgi:hypothetical protein